MADGRDHPPGSLNYRATFPWMEIFRCFQIALDPRKLFVAAVGILAASLGWFVLSAIFYYKMPERNDAKYQSSTIAAEFEGRTHPATNAPYSEADRNEIARQRYETDLAEWRVMADLAAPSRLGTATDPATPAGRFRTMPWDEYRGPNPFLFVSNLIGGSAGTAIGRFLSGTVPVLVEPLNKLLIPVTGIISTGVNGWTRFYLMLVLLWGLAVWAFFGGIITRLAAVQLANKGPVSLRQTVQFVSNRYVNYLLSPMVPLAIIAAVTVGLIVYGLLSLIPVLGDLLFLGLLLPLIVVAGGIMAVFLVGLLGYPLMYPTLSVEGDSSDTFDALSRSINYVYQAPWQYAWYWFVAVVYGAVVTFFVLFFVSLMVYLGKWAVGLPAGAVWSERKPEFLFIYAPESFGWRELLLKDSPYEVREVMEATATGRLVNGYVPVHPTTYSHNDYYWYNTLGARIVSIWLALIFLMMVGFSYSFFWSAATAIYFLLRKKVDEADSDEIFLEEDEPEAPLAPPKIADGTGPTAATPGPNGATSLPVLSSPPVVPPPPPAAVSPPPPPPLPPIPLSGSTPEAPVVPPPPPANGDTEKPTL